MDSLVSIIIPLYNAEDYIAETITSALNQTWPHKEIIVVDDGSEDNSYNIALRFVSENVIVLKQENKGASAARNKGLSIAKGSYVQFLDADDLLSANKIAEQLSVIDGHQDHLAISRTIYFSADNYRSEDLDHNQKVTIFKSPQKLLINMYKATVDTNHWGMITSHSWLTPRHLIEKAGPWNEELSVDDDGEFFCRVALQSKQITYIPDAVNYYRKTNGAATLSARKDRKAMESILHSNQLKYRHLASKLVNPDINKAFAKQFMESAVTFYPRFYDLYAEAIAMVKQLGGTDYVPAIGGTTIEFIKKTFGWKFARLILHCFQKPAH